MRFPSSTRDLWVTGQHPRRPSAAHTMDVHSTARGGRRTRRRTFSQIRDALSPPSFPLTRLSRASDILTPSYGFNTPRRPLGQSHSGCIPECPPGCWDGAWGTWNYQTCLNLKNKKKKQTKTKWKLLIPNQPRVTCCPLCI